MINGKDQLDTAIDIVTPENVLIQYQLSGPFRRLLAYMIDLIVRVVFFSAIAFLLGLVATYVDIGGFVAAFLFLLFFALSWFYGGVLEAYWNGQTFGKRALGIRVVTITGEPIDALQAVLRNVLREIDSLTLFFLPMAWLIPYYPEGIGFPCFTYLVALISMTCTRRFQRLGDLACGTMVVVEQRRWHHGLVSIEDTEVIQLASQLPADLELSRSLGSALSHYVERRRVFPPARRADLARHIGIPLCRRFGLPPETSHDMLLCALYYRTFISDQLDEDLQAPPPAEPSDMPIVPRDDAIDGDQDGPTGLPHVRTQSFSSQYRDGSRFGGSP